MTSARAVHGSAGSSLLLVGSVIVDLVLPVPALPERGGDLLARDAAFVVGGGYYVLAAAERAGMPARYAGHHGTGPLGDRVRAALDALGVPTAFSPEPSADTGVCVTLVEPDGERTFVTHPGVEARLDASALATLTVSPRDVVYVSGYDLAYPVSGPAITSWLAHLPDIGLVVDPGPLVHAIPSGLLARVLGRTTVLTLNRREAALLTGTPADASVAEVASDLRTRLPAGALLVVRSGAGGAHVSGRDIGGELVHVPAPAVQAVDSTGAGDVHTGTLVAALAAGADGVDATRRANAAAALVVSAPRSQR